MKRFISTLPFLFSLGVLHSQIITQAWQQSYDGPQHSTDQAMAMTLDGSGNVCVTGQSIGSGNTFDYDYATIKYSNQGVPLWTNRYNGPAAPATSWDSATAIASDTTGNIFVTGYSYGATGGYDYATIGYSPAGSPLWTNRYNGPGNSDDFAKAIAVDASGNVFITGYSTGSGSSFDFATIKYSGAGQPLWTNRYNGPSNGYDRATALALDTNGNVFVTGYSMNTGNGNDYATVAYSNDGISLWTNRYDGPAHKDDRATAIAVSRNSNVFVTGSSTNDVTAYDYATIGYSNSGTPLWTNRYDGPISSNDFPAAIATDLNGNVFVTGSSARAYSFAFGLDDDYATIAYSNAGLPLWTNRYDGAYGDDQATSIAVDGTGDVFVTGWSIVIPSTQYSYTCATIAYGPTGAILWTNRYSSLSFGQAVRVTDNGEVFVAAYRGVGGSDYDYLTMKYSPVRPFLDFHFDNQLVLSWTNTGFGLQSAPSLTGPFTNIPNASTPYTNSATQSQQYFRLISN